MVQGEGRSYRIVKPCTLHPPGYFLPFRENPYMFLNRLSQCLKVVAALEHGDEPAPCVDLGDAPNSSGELFITVRSEAYMRQRIRYVGVEAGRDKDKLWPELFHRLLNPFQGFSIRFNTCARRHGEVLIESFPLTVSRF